MDVQLLKVFATRHGDDFPALAKALGIARSTMYQKLKNETQQFTQSEIRKIAERYKLTANQIQEIFFQ